MQGRWRRRLLSLGVWLTLAGVLCACAVKPVEPEVSEGSGESSSLADSFDWTDRMSYEEVYARYMQFAGRWRIAAVCAESAENGTAESRRTLREQCVGRVLEVGKSRVKFLGESYRQAAEEESRVCKKTKEEFCRACGDPDAAQIPLPDTEEKQLYADLIMQTNGTSGETHTFTLCLPEDGKLLFGVDHSVYFLAEPIESCEALSYTAFCEAYPDYQGKWKLKELCARAKIGGELSAYLSENAPGAVLDVTAEGFGILNARYTPSEARLHRETKRAFCVEGGYLDWDGVPLSDAADLHEIFHFTAAETGGIRFFTLCLYGEDQLLVGLDDDLYFIAQRAE